MSFFSRSSSSNDRWDSGNFGGRHDRFGGGNRDRPDHWGNSGRSTNSSDMHSATDFRASSSRSYGALNGAQDDWRGDR